MPAGIRKYTVAESTNLQLFQNGFVELDAAGNTGDGEFQIFIDDAQVASQTTLTNATDDEDLTVSFGIQNGAAAAKTMTIDYILAAVER